MGRKIKRGAVAALLLCLILSVCAQAVETRTYVLGDVNNFVYNGPGSADDVYIDPAWQSWLESYSVLPLKDFDEVEIDQMIPCTFLFELAPEEVVISAELTLGLRTTIPDNYNSGLLVSGEGIRPSLGDLGWIPLSTTYTTERSVDLSDIFGHNVITNLQDGELSLAVGGKVAVDYALLSIEVVPEPVTLIFLAMGAGVLRKRFI